MKDKDVIKEMITRFGRSVSLNCGKKSIYTPAIVQELHDQKYLFIIPVDVQIPKADIGECKIYCASMGKSFIVEICKTYTCSGNPLYRWMICKEIKDYTSRRTS